ncbi:MAG TPA: hypothetical protein VGP91_01200 [Actinoplanes sp.]|nr:hypothetical protein [Actinoplanes sp.]
MPDPAHQADASCQQHPPVVGRLRLVEQFLTRLEGQHVANREQLEQLIVAEPVEQGEMAQIFKAHQFPDR